MTQSLRATGLRSPLAASRGATYSPATGWLLPPMWPARQPRATVDRALARHLAAQIQALPGWPSINALLALVKSPPGTLYVEGFCVREGETPVVVPHAWLDTSQTWDHWMEEDGDFRIVDPTPGYCEEDAPDVAYFTVEGWDKESVADRIRRNEGRELTEYFPLLDHDDIRLRDGINWHWARIEAQMHVAALFEERMGESYFPPDFDFRRLMPRRKLPHRSRS